MWLMISIIACYWAVYNPRRQTLENYQFLNSVEDIENNLIRIRQKQRNTTITSFVENYFTELAKSDIYKENTPFKKMVVI
jgi:hypothetical protein